MGMIQTLVQAWKIPEMRKKILYTLIMMVVFRLGSNIPVPCIDRSQLAAMFDANESGLFGLFDLFSGGSFSNFTIFALSITPYITASIILQLLTVAIPKLEELAKQGQEGQRKIAQWTRYLTVVLALVQAIGYTFGLFRNVLSNSIFAKIVIVLTLVAGTAFLMWLGERINENGIGNGISLIIFAGIVSRIPTSISRTIKGLSAGTVSIVSVIIFLIFALAVIMGIVMVQEGNRKIPVQYAKRVVGRKMYGGQSTHIPLKVNQAGVIPVIFAISLLQIPATIAYMTGNDNGFSRFVAKYLSTTGTPGIWIYLVLDILLIIFFTYFYGSITVNPLEIADNMKANGGFIPGIRPGKPTSDYIGKVLSRLNFSSAIFLAIIAAIPIIIGHFTSFSSSFGGTSLIIAVGVALDTMKALETQMVMRNYSGFLK